MSELRTCRGCGCTDLRACPGGCSWVLLEVESPTGICSACAEGMDWDPMEMANAWDIDLPIRVGIGAGVRP